MKKLFLSLALLLIGGAELFAACPYRTVRTGYVKRQRGGRPYRRLEARDTAIDDDADIDADDEADDARPARALRGDRYKDVQLDANIDSDQDSNDNDDDADMGDLDR